MVSDVLLRLKPELALTLDADNYACGTYVGYGFTLRALNDKNCIIFNSWARKSALTTKTVDDFFKEYMSKPENSFVKAYKAGEPNISAVLFAGNDDAQAVLDIKRFITDMVKYYSANYYSNACAKCNSSIGLSFAKAADGNLKQLCKMCVQSEEDAAEKAAVTQSAKPIDSQPVQQPMQQPVTQPMQQPAVNQTQQTANSAVGIYGIPVPATQPIADDQLSLRRQRFFPLRQATTLWTLLTLQQHPKALDIQPLSRWLNSSLRQTATSLLSAEDFHSLHIHR